VERVGAEEEDEVEVIDGGGIALQAEMSEVHAVVPSSSRQVY
jgi:hypothetical protein